ncbi:MAG: tetratricopeptide repeat protein [Proteobacteria bacterium]|nr:tetratricopeptide repeat protein [Pseudomonadota bacterium]
MSLIEKALRQLESDQKKSTYSFEDFAESGAASARAAGEGLYEKPENSSGELLFQQQKTLLKKWYGMSLAILCVIFISVVLFLIAYNRQHTTRKEQVSVPLVKAALVKATEKPAAVPAENKGSFTAQQQTLNAPSPDNSKKDTRSPDAQNSVPAAASPADGNVQKNAAQMAGSVPAHKQQVPRHPAVKQESTSGQRNAPLAASREAAADKQPAAPVVNHEAAVVPFGAQEESSSLNNTGLLYLEKGDAARAQACFEKALALTPDNEKALNNLGLSFYAQGKIEKAIPYYQRALQVHPDNLESCVNLGIAYRKSGHYADAEGAFKRALFVNPAHPETLYNYALLLKDIGQKEKSRFYLEQFLRVAPAYLQGLADQVREYLQAGHN